MKIFKTAVCIFVLLLPVAAQAAGSVLPSFDLEQKIAYQQGQFGALYARCGSHADQEIIGGSLTVWRNETFRGYNGTAIERAGLEKTFDQAVHDVSADTAACQDWISQAAATWHGMVQLARYGTPVASN